MLYFVCRTYQRFTKAGVCTCHSIKEKTVTDAVVAKVREVCQAYLNPEELLPVAREAVENAGKQSGLEMELQMLQSKIDSLTANLDRMYTDRLSCCRSRTSSASSAGSSWNGSNWRKSGRNWSCVKKALSAVRTGPGNWYNGSSKPPGRAGSCWSALSSGWN